MSTPRSGARPLARKIEAEGGDLRRANKVNCPKWGKRRWPGPFTSPEHLKSGGVPAKFYFVGRDDKQLDDLSIAVTRKEQDEPQE